MTRFRSWWPPHVTRDQALFVAGLLGVAHETLLGGVTERPWLLTVFAGMMGLPTFLRKDDADQEPMP